VRTHFCIALVIDVLYVLFRRTLILRCLFYDRLDQTMQRALMRCSRHAQCITQLHKACNFGFERHSRRIIYQWLDRRRRTEDSLGTLNDSCALPFGCHCFCTLGSSSPSSPYEAVVLLAIVFLPFTFVFVIDRGIKGFNRSLKTRRTTCATRG